MNLHGPTRRLRSGRTRTKHQTSHHKTMRMTLEVLETREEAMDQQELARLPRHCHRVEERTGLVARHNRIMDRKEDRCLAVLALRCSPSIAECP